MLKVLILLNLTSCIFRGNLALKFKKSKIDLHGSSVAECIERSKWQFTKIVMMSREVQTVPYATKIIKALSSPVIIMGDDTKISMSKVTFILYSIKRYLYYNLFKDVRIEDQVRVIVIWKWPDPKNKDFSYDKARGTLNDILYVMWLHKIYDVYIFIEDKYSDVNVYTYWPYGKRHCNEVGPPMLIDTWNSTTKTFMTKMLKIENTRYDTRHQLMKNLYGCPVHVLVKNRPPESVALMTADNKVVLKGSGGSILSALMKKHNFTIKITLAEDILRSTHRDKHGLAVSSYTKKMLMRDLRTGKYDFAFGVFPHLGYFSYETDLSQYYLNEHFAFYVPCGTKKGILSIWEDFYLEFPAYIWLCICSVLFLVALVMKIIATVLPRENPIFRSFWGNVFGLWTVHVENNIKAKTVTITLRIVVTALLFYCTIISVAYRASLKSLLMAPWEGNSIETWDELEQSSLSIAGIPDMYDVFNKISTRHEVLRKLKKRFHVITTGTFRDIVDDVTIKKNTAYFGPESMIMYYNSMENEKNGTIKQTICQVNRIVASSPSSPFLMRKGSIFLQIMNKVTNDMVQTGQMKQFALPQAVKQVSRVNIKDLQLPISMHHLQGVFLILIVGLAIAAVTFLFEKFYWRYNQRGSTISRRQ